MLRTVALGCMRLLYWDRFQPGVDCYIGIGSRNVMSTAILGSVPRLLYWERFPERDVDCSNSQYSSRHHLDFASLAPLMSIAILGI